MIASIRPRDILMTADGRSTLVTRGHVTGFNDHFQKLYPIPDHAVVIGEMGENRLDDEPLKKFLGDFMSQLNTGNLTIQEIADQLRDYAHVPIRRRLNAEGNPPSGVNLWVAGFSMHQKEPSMIELFWKLHDNVLYTEERTFVPTTIVPGGTGVAQIEKVDWHRIKGKTTAEVRAYHAQLMHEAITAPVDPNTVGGDIHELLITPEKWEWTIPPRSGLAAMRPTTKNFRPN
jgi:hypothetical protein